MVGCTRTPSKPRLTHVLDTYFSTKFSHNEPGASIAVLKGDEWVYSNSWGLADLNTGEPITSKTLFNLGSITKPFVAYGILILQDRGKLSLDDPLSMYFPEFRNKPIAEAVTLRHLLTHTSGLPDVRKVREDSVFYLTAKDAESWAPIMNAETLNFQPGERYEYSNPAFNALALVIEQVSDMKWQQFVEEEIFRPSGMMHTTITDGPHPETGVSHGYIQVNGSWTEKDYGEEPTFAAAGNGGVWSSADELVAFNRGMYGHEFLAAETIEQSHTVYTPSNWSGDTPPFIGLCWFIGHTADGLKIVEHTGTQGGFFAHYVSVPDKKILYLLLANRPVDREGFYQKVLKELGDRNWLD